MSFIFRTDYIDETTHSGNRGDLESEVQTFLPLIIIVQERRSFLITYCLHFSETFMIQGHISIDKKIFLSGRSFVLST